jgi:protein TonB
MSPTFLMPFSHLRNKHRRIQFASIFIAVSMIHIIVIQSVWSHPVDKNKHRENISFLESFAVQAEDTAQAEDAIEPQITIPDEKNEQDRYPETYEKEITLLKPSISTETSVSTRRLTPQALQPEGTQTPRTSITPPTAHANSLSNPPPPYPRQSRRLGEQGKVVLTAEIATNGKALQALINISSGYPRLDRAALDSVLNWRFIPGNKAGVPQQMWVNIPINFVLE